MMYVTNSDRQQNKQTKFQDKDMNKFSGKYGQKRSIKGAVVYFTLDLTFQMGSNY